MKRNQHLGGTLLCCAMLLAALAIPAPLHAADTGFAVGSLIIPMDTTYQDSGMLTAYGLVDRLLRAGVPVNWCILPGKTVVPADADFTASATDLVNSAVISAHGYRGGPFVISAAEAPTALSIINAWQAIHAATAVHVATQPFTAPVRLVLSAAPRIAVFADGSQSIAFGYLNAAGITDEQDLAWSAASIDLLTPAQVAGSSMGDADDGALFNASGQPRFSQFVSAHWNLASVDIPNVVPELASFLQFPVHVFAQCQSVRAIENATPAGRFLTTTGYVLAARPVAVQFANQDLPFVQFDGAFVAISGSDAAFALSPGGAYFDDNAVLIRGATAPVNGMVDILITGYADGTCPITDLGHCAGTGPKGKVTYLAGHQYTTSLPISSNTSTQGVRFFLNALLAGSCAHAEGQPVVTLAVAAPETTLTATIDVALTCRNDGPAPALAVQASYGLPIGAVFVAATGGGSCSAGVVNWTLGDLAAGASVEVVVTLTLPNYGTYVHQAGADFAVGLTNRSVTTESVNTVYSDPATAAPLDARPILGLVAAPSPTTTGRLAVWYTLARDENAVIELCDLHGRRILSRDLGQPGAGRHALTLGDDRRLASGVYFARLVTPSGTCTVKVIVTK
jgi:hypothetical protein